MSSGSRPSSTASRRRGTGGGAGSNGRILLALLAVVAAIVLVGYFAFVNTGRNQGNGGRPAPPVAASP